MTREELLEKVNDAISAYDWGTPVHYSLLISMRDYLLEEKGEVIFPPRTDGIEIRWPTYLDPNRDLTKERKFDIVKWEYHSPRLVFDIRQNKHVPVTESCYSIATLEWNEKDKWFDTTTCGTRLLETELTPVARGMLSQFITQMAERFAKEDLENGNYD